MATITIDIPANLFERLHRQAEVMQCQLEELIIERLKSGGFSEESQSLTLEDRLERFYEESDLFEHPGEEEKRRYHPASEDELENLAHKAAKGDKLLSQILIEERGEC